MSDRLREVLRKVGEGMSPINAFLDESEPHTLTEAILMARQAWATTSDEEMPAIVYGVVREAYRYGQRSGVPPIPERREPE